ncbi:hypothetical protein PSI23_18775 [Xenorhabdus sp. XENO-10]|uniref:Uncharacterized protein n=1 Tax=Xenorhabdus yunnanensis TaxID=3025878 RepID=A0ABT5LJU4_9GAMM|nr:hypothetical protein [Xenorhabdus yunnanensis]MDC9591275.1 hypothetical protein [Xenorhabdus yunnanensis]
MRSHIQPVDGCIYSRIKITGHNIGIQKTRQSSGMGYRLDFRKKVPEYKNKHSLTFGQTSAQFDIAICTLFGEHKNVWSPPFLQH